MDWLDRFVCYFGIISRQWRWWCHKGVPLTNYSSKSCMVLSLVAHMVHGKQLIEESILLQWVNVIFSAIGRDCSRFRPVPSSNCSIPNRHSFKLNRIIKYYLIEEAQSFENPLEIHPAPWKTSYELIHYLWLNLFSVGANEGPHIQQHPGANWFSPTKHHTHPVGR